MVARARLAQERTGRVRAPAPARTARHPGDVARVAIGLVVLAVATLGVERRDLTQFEVDLFRLVNDLPSQLSGVLVSVMQAGNLVAAPLVGVVIAVVVRRRRVAFDAALAGSAAWVGAKLVKDLVQRPRPGGLLGELTRGESVQGMGFVSGHTAVAAALVTAVCPYLPRPARRTLWVVPWVVGLARIYEGAHLPLDVVGGAALGWAIGAGIHVLIGAPHRRPSLADASAALARTGWQATHVERVPGTPRGSFPFVARLLDDSTVFVKLLDPEPRDRDWLYRATRFVLFREARDEAAIEHAIEQAEHEAALTLLARCHGVRVPVVRAIVHDHGRAWLVEDHVVGRDLERCRADELHADALRDAWRQVKMLHDAGIAHRDLVGGNIILDGVGQAWLVDLAHASSGARVHAFDNDVAELLADTAARVGPDAAIAAARDVLGAARVAAALLELHPFALTAETRRRLREHPDLLPRLRHAVADLAPEPASRVPAPSPRLTAPSVATGGSLLATLIVLTAAAGPTDVVSQLTAPSWRWLGLAVLAAAGSFVAGGGALAGALDRPLALGRSTLVRAIAANQEHGTPRRAAWALTYGLRRVGVRPDEARWAAGRLRIAWWVALAGVGIAAATASSRLPPVNRPPHAPLLAVLAAGLIVLAFVGRASHRSAHRYLPSRLSELPGSAVAVMAGSAVSEVLLAGVCAAAAVGAFGGGVPVAAVLLLQVGLLATHGSGSRMMPALRAVLGTGALASLGMPLAAALSSVVVREALLRWTPAGVGAAMRRLGRDRVVP